jgi:hypothetical protein
VELCRQVPRFARRDCTIRIAVGLESTALIPRTWKEMKEVEQKLRGAGFRDVTVGVVTNSPVHLSRDVWGGSTRQAPFNATAEPGPQHLTQPDVRLVVGCVNGVGQIRTAARSARATSRGLHPGVEDLGMPPALPAAHEGSQ